jgi:hypothetical protein
VEEKEAPSAQTRPLEFDLLMHTDDLLGRLITLNGTLAGGAIFLLTDWSLGVNFRAAMVVLILALLLALRGRMMEPGHDFEATRRKKSRWLEASSAALILGLFLAGAGVLMR